MNASLDLNKISLFILNFTIWLLIFLLPNALFAQQNKNDTTLQQATLENCIHYALDHNPNLRNSKIDEELTETQIQIKLSDWYPQVNFNYNFQHNFQLQTLNFNGNLTHSGSTNTSGLLFGALQNIFNRDVLLASRTAKDVKLLSGENTREQKINLAVAVSKLFYDIILTTQQIKVTEEDIKRIELSLKDAFYQYQSGITDKTDYKRASISLNNAKAQKKSGNESLKAKYAYLKQLLGYPELSQIELAYDTSKMENEIFIDTLQTFDYNNRIEIQQLETQKKLQQYNLQYVRWSFLPNVSAFGNYNLNFLNNQFSKIYQQAYPNSNIGINLSVPIFQGGKRTQQIRQAQLQINQVDNLIQNFQNTINTQYQQALAVYKSNLYDYLSLKENLSLANEVYEIIRLQYRSGIKTYLEVINAETDLRTAQINYYNALYQLLSSKIDVAQATGNINY